MTISHCKGGLECEPLPFLASLVNIDSGERGADVGLAGLWGLLHFSTTENPSLVSYFLQDSKVQPIWFTYKKAIFLPLSPTR